MSYKFKVGDTGKTNMRKHPEGKVNYGAPLVWAVFLIVVVYGGLFGWWVL